MEMVASYFHSRWDYKAPILLDVEPNLFFAGDSMSTNLRLPHIAARSKTRAYKSWKVCSKFNPSRLWRTIS